MLIEATKPRDETDEASLSARAAWLYFSGGMTQGDIARRLGVANSKAHRLIARASRDGLIRVFVDAEVSECLDLEDRLSRAFGLETCQVGPDLAEAHFPVKALGIAGASFLRNTIERGDYGLIGIGHGRTLAAAVNHMPHVAAGETRFVSMMGGFTRRFAASPHDVIHRLAEKTGAEAFQIPLPSFANTEADKAVLLAQPGIADVFALACSAPVMLVGIGDVSDEGYLASNRMISADELAELHAAGAVGELLGHFFDADGNVTAQSFSARALTPGLDHLTKSRIVALVGGTAKIAATMALLRSGVVKGLVTDEVTARAIVRAVAGAKAGAIAGAIADDGHRE